jgi:hypothetical protein
MVCLHSNVVDAGAPANEIETTFEMIEAGENVLLEELGGVVSSYLNDGKISIFQRRNGRHK